MANVIIILLIVAYCAWVIYTHFFKKKDGIVRAIFMCVN